MAERALASDSTRHSQGATDDPPRLAENVRLEISITLDEFGWSALEDHACGEGIELERLVALACSYYQSELAAGRTATRVPRFGKPATERQSRTLVLELSARSLKGLEQEAERQGLRLERLVEHAAIFYLADLDAGRVAERIIRNTGPS